MTDGILDVEDDGRGSRDDDQALTDWDQLDATQLIFFLRSRRGLFVQNLISCGQNQTMRVTLHSFNTQKILRHQQI